MLPGWSHGGKPDTPVRRIAPRWKDVTREKKKGRHAMNVGGTLGNNMTRRQQHKCGQHTWVRNRNHDRGGQIASLRALGEGCGKQIHGASIRVMTFFLVLCSLLFSRILLWFCSFSFVFFDI